MYSARELGIKVESTSGDEELCLCPFHGDSNASAWFNRTTGLWYCAVCHQGYNYSQLAQILLGMDKEEADEFISEEDNPAAFSVSFQELTEDRSRFYGEQVYHNYFKARKIEPRTIKRFGIEWSYEENAALIPITDRKGARVGAILRYEKPAPQRYRKIGNITPLWPLDDMAKVGSRDTPLIVEGAWSVMRIWEVLQALRISWVVPLAVLGSHVSKEVVPILNGLEPIFVLDGDEGGRQGVKQVKELNSFWNAMTISISPDDMTRKQIAGMLKTLNLTERR